MNAIAPAGERDISGLGTFDIGGVVAAALADDELRRTAAAAGLDRQQVVDLVRNSEVAWGRSGQIDTHGRLDQAGRRQQTLLATLYRTHTRPWWLWVYYGLAALFVVIGTVEAIDTGESPPATIVAALILTIPFLGVGSLIERRRRRRRSLLAAEADEATMAVIDARKELEQELAEMVIKPLIRAELNRRKGARYDTSVSAVESAGLAEILDPKYLIPTDSGRRLDRFLDDMPGGSIGLSGPRGAGKSSLIQANCPSGDNQPEGLLGVVVSAPVQFQPREFILHLFSELCRAVLGRDAVEDLRHPMSQPRASTSLNWALGCSGLVLAVGAALLGNELAGSLSNVTLGIVVTAIGLVSTLGLLVLRVRTSRIPRLSRLWEARIEASSRRFAGQTSETAEDQLRAIWFQQTFSEGWSGSLKLPGGLQGGVEGGRELARQQMSMPDIVSELKRLIGMVTADGQIQVRVGIDELDKIDSPEDAARFFNEIKVLFGIEDCFFLVSVSEDALASFERRGMPMRDVFDSSFDDVIRLDHLCAHDAIAMLRERVIGMPTPFLLLCHCLSGGLPRDLIRSARDLVSLLPADPASDTDLTLSEACQKLVAAQLASKAGGATTTAQRQLAPAEAVLVRDLADRLVDSAATAERLHAYAMTTADEINLTATDRAAGGGTQAAVDAFAAELATFAYFSATLLELFDDVRPESYFAAGIHREDAVDEDGRSVVDQLAYARQAFAVHPRAAWSAISSAREAAGDIEAPSYPFSRLVSA